LKLMSSDELAQAGDADLKKLILNLRSRIKESESEDVSNDFRSLNELQTYYCYVYRELERRGIM
jgi:hypothetical protein